jgi:predicted phage terminase large subunit-like protein
MDPATITIRPQPGFQERVLSCDADIAIVGGSAGCGKTWVEIMEALYHKDVPGFYAVFFRRTTVQIRNPGGLWDEARKVYPLTGGRSNEQSLEYEWDSGARVKMAHLEYENTVEDWQGSQVCLFLFDELTHFTERMFFYMLSRNRSTCGVRPYIRATCNPDADSWVAKFIEWWIDQATGFPIVERAGVFRYMARVADRIVWGDSRAEVMEKCPGTAEVDIKSVTFIPGKLDDNQELLRADPGYRGNLMALSRVERGRLLDGNWKIRAAAGNYFRRDEVRIIEAVPVGAKWVRRWDLAATEPSENNRDPDWTAGVKMGKTKAGRYVIGDVVMVRKRSHAVRDLIQAVAKADGVGVSIGLPQDPGQAGVDQAQGYVRDLAGYRVWIERETGDKETRADPFAAQWQHGNVDMVAAPWNDQFLAFMEAFPTKGVHDDPVDACSGAFNKLAKGGGLGL